MLLFNEDIEVVDSYKYLGSLFNFRGDLKKAKSELINQSSRAMYILVSKGRKHDLPVDIRIQ